MKIAVDIRDAVRQKTGKGWYVYNMVGELLALDRDNSYILYSNSKKNPFAGFQNATLKFIESSPVKWHFKVLRDLKEEKADIFFAPTSYIIPAFAPKNLRVIITVHDLAAFLYPSANNTKAMIVERLTLKRALKKASDVFVVSENTKKDLLKKFKFREHRIHLTPCAASQVFSGPVSEEELSAFKSEKNLPDNFLLAVGTLEPRKNFSTLIKSFVNIKKWHPGYKLVIVGKKGWKYGEIESTIKKYGLEKEVIFPGYLKDADLKKMYKLAKVFVFPSLYEGFGIPPLEAMASGCPVISSNRASMPEVIGDAGLLIDPTNAYKLADAVSGLLENENVRNMMVERGYRQAEKFKWENGARTALDVFLANQ